MQNKVCCLCRQDMTPGDFETMLKLVHAGGFSSQFEELKSAQTELYRTTLVELQDQIPAYGDGNNPVSAWDVDQWDAIQRQLDSQREAANRARQEGQLAAPPFALPLESCTQEIADGALDYELIMSHRDLEASARIE